nr:uncharacterized protein LOC127340149 [Lolium perenne]
MWHLPPQLVAAGPAAPGESAIKSSSLKCGSPATAHDGRAAQTSSCGYGHRLRACLVWLFWAFHQKKQPKRAKGLGFALGFSKSHTLSFRWGKAPFEVLPELPEPSHSRPRSFFSSSSARVPRPGRVPEPPPHVAPAHRRRRRTPPSPIAAAARAAPPRTPTPYAAPPRRRTPHAAPPHRRRTPPVRVAAATPPVPVPVPVARHAARRPSPSPSPHAARPRRRTPPRPRLRRRTAPSPSPPAAPPQDRAVLAIASRSRRSLCPPFPWRRQFGMHTTFAFFATFVWRK